MIDQIDNPLRHESSSPTRIANSWMGLEHEGTGDLYQGGLAKCECF
jgi:hypothetical protein